ncbi:MAG: 4-hydroxy-3-methylbut-2-en-1-yl diphosphate synthase [Flavobacteriales bacterium]|nr:4-hydroxy-3-methylbut-2-en-1-yl diphosphate synthase [Flavobacteriales bacterium]|tara:strand:+ start:138 stop:2036 length:1899 start_codon:yes stop_codon:yes gene_type:complete
MTKNNWKYCNDYTNYSRFVSREVKIGDLALGANNPLRIQSMTTTDTMDTIATVEQTIRMVESGCEYVRITAPSKKEAENLGKIKKELKNRGYDVPLIADIHYTPNAAEIAARLIEKVRVNPGNYADKKKFQQIEYSDDDYNAELDRIREKFSPLVNICKEYGTAMRIGTNHGSLSDRILSRYGDTPLGMVESAMEFLRICEDLNYHNIVLSMKASNPKVMVNAYRLLVNHMMEVGMNYPLHLGVTEAGDGEDGRIKSAAGIGTLLEDGLGDTIRVSLTEDPEFEAPVAKALADRYTLRNATKKLPQIEKIHVNPFEYKRRVTNSIENIGGSEVPRVIVDLSDVHDIKPAHLFPYGYIYHVSDDKWTIQDVAADFIYLGDQSLTFDLPGTLGVIQNRAEWEPKSRYYPVFEWGDDIDTESLCFVEAKTDEIYKQTIDLPKNAVLILTTTHDHGMADHRRIFNYFIENKIQNPVIVKREYINLDESLFQLYASTDFGALLIDGLCDGVWVDVDLPRQRIMATIFGFFQATRTRISKTEYISCPSCGRTLFDLQETTQLIRSRTSHLKGVKIGIMGCIVNGPGEMADADYGYVGSGVGKITLYKGQEVVDKAIPSEEAVDRLIDLIRSNGDWVEA